MDSFSAVGYKKKHRLEKPMKLRNQNTIDYYYKPKMKLKMEDLRIYRQHSCRTNLPNSLPLFSSQPTDQVLSGHVVITIVTKSGCYLQCKFYGKVYVLTPLSVIAMYMFSTLTIGFLYFSILSLPRFQRLLKAT